MKNVSTQFLIDMAERRDFYYTAVLTTKNGDHYNLDKETIMQGGNGVSESAETTSLPLGCAICETLTLCLDNRDEKWSKVDFYYAEIDVVLHFDLSTGETENVYLGKYTVISPETYGSTINLSGVDNMYKADKVFNSNSFALPSTAELLFVAACGQAGLPTVSTKFKNNDFKITTIPEDATCREIIGLVAMIAGGNATMDEYGRVRIISFDSSSFTSIKNLDGGRFDADNPYSTGDKADGGNFRDYSSGEWWDGGKFSDTNQFLYLNKGINLTLGTDKVVVTGVKTTVDSKEYMFGKDGYVLVVENELGRDNPQDMVNRIGNALVNLEFRPFQMDHTAYPLAEVGDLALVFDRNSGYYFSILTDVSYQFRGITTLKCTADDPLRNTAVYNSQQAKAISRAREETQREISAYDALMETLTNLMTQSFGVFKTEEVQPDGSVIYNMHNKPTLAQSTTCWKMTGGALLVGTRSNTSQQWQWKAGIDANGNAAVNVLSAIGVNCDWLNGGVINGQTINGGTITGSVLNVGLRPDKKYNFSVDKNGNLVAYSGTFSGAISGSSITGTSISGGSISGTEISGGSAKLGQNKDGSWNFSVDASGNLVAKSANISGTINSTDGTIGGFELSANTIKSVDGNLELNKNGSISGNNWSIDNNGYAQFSNISITGGSVNNATIGGNTSISTSGDISSSGTISGPYSGTANLDTASTYGGQQLGTYIDTLITNSIQSVSISTQTLVTKIENAEQIKVKALLINGAPVARTWIKDANGKQVQVWCAQTL